MIKKYTILLMIGFAGIGGLILIFYLSWFWRLFLIPIIGIIGFGLINSELENRKKK